jgi:hypothetical protein
LHPNRADRQTAIDTPAWSGLLDCTALLVIIASTSLQPKSVANHKTVVSAKPAGRRRNRDAVSFSFNLKIKNAFDPPLHAHKRRRCVEAGTKIK